MTPHAPHLAETLTCRLHFLPLLFRFHCNTIAVLKQYDRDKLLELLVRHWVCERALLPLRRTSLPASDRADHCGDWGGRI